jgi:carbon storage regulator
MLVLSRKRSEQIWIGSTIRITVVKLEGNQVRLGIEAPGKLPIVRAELIARGRRLANERDRDAGAKDGPQPE